MVVPFSEGALRKASWLWFGGMFRGAQAFKCGAGLESRGKFFFVGRQRETDCFVESIHTVGLHFLSCFLRGPTLFRDPVACYIHSRAVVADTAVDENLLAGFSRSRVRNCAKFSSCGLKHCQWSGT